MAIRDSRVVLTQMVEPYPDEQSSRDAAIDEFFAQLNAELGLQNSDPLSAGEQSGDYLVVYDKFAGWTR